MQTNVIEMDERRATMRPSNARYSVEQVAEALRRSAGVQAAAGRMLKVSRSTICGYAARHPELREVIEETREVLLDYAECRLHQLIEAGNVSSVISYVRCFGKERGYSYSCSCDGRKAAASSPAAIPVESPYDLSRLTSDEVNQLQRLLAKAEREPDPGLPIYDAEADKDGFHEAGPRAGGRVGGS